MLVSPIQGRKPTFTAGQSLYRYSGFLLALKNLGVGRNEAFFGWFPNF